MFPLKNFRKNLTDKLDEIKVFRKFDDVSRTFKIVETKPEAPDRTGKEALCEVQVKNIPNQHIWIFDNEFGNKILTSNSSNKKQIESQKGAFTSAGKKVEKTIIYFNSNRFYLFMIEMKRTISPRKMQKDVIKKFESSLATLSVFIAASTDFSQLEDTTIYPVGICCYNYFEDEQNSQNNDPNRTEGCVRLEYGKGKRMIPLKVEPLTLNSMDIPVFFKENPNRDPVTDSFEIDLQNILEEILNI
jgi:hypothetical protein